nr:fused MFS/spermidine synthase [Alloactinosynnema sp. L-07]
MPGLHRVRFGTAELLADLDRDNGWLLTVEGVAQSYVDLDDPWHLEFDYVRRIGDIIDALPSGPLDVLHIGGGAATLPRYLAATRPDSDQLVIDADGPLIDLVRAELGLDTIPGLRVMVAEGRPAVAELPDADYDLVVLDAYERAAMPGGLATREFLADAQRTLRPHGTMVVNISDGPGLRFARRFVATMLSLFPHALLLAEPTVLRGRRYGNLVVAGSADELPVRDIASRAAAAAFPARCVPTEQLKALAARAVPITDANPMATPTPPEHAFGLPDRSGQ